MDQYNTEYHNISSYLVLRSFFNQYLSKPPTENYDFINASFLYSQQKVYYQIVSYQELIQNYNVIRKNVILYSTAASLVDYSYQKQVSLSPIYIEIDKN